ncbi:MAG: class I SAM-dependent methyltransferase [Peptostreptococcales bacterium]|jgi:tRNA (adenine22-N1)-methyltransferase
MINLTDRLLVMAKQIDIDETVADIGTDHGYIPIYLHQKNPYRKIIMTDINKGPMEIATKHLLEYGIPIQTIDSRLGSGLTPLKNNECDCVIIAGMGGILISDILSEDLKKSLSFPKFILQPRNAQDKLRKWLLDNGFDITNEFLVREGKFICEVLITGPKQDGSNQESLQGYDEIYYEIGKKLIENKDPLLKDFIRNKIRIENNIVDYVKNMQGERSQKQLEKSKKRILRLQEVLQHET